MKLLARRSTVVYPPAARISYTARRRADEDVPVASRATSLGRAKGEAAGELIDGGVSARGRNLIHSLFVEIGDEEISGPVQCHASRAAEGKAGGQSLTVV